MIIYGASNKTLAGYVLADKCSNCSQQGCVELYVLQRFFHVFFVPVFAAGKTAGSQCKNCKQKLKLRQMPESYKNEFHSLKGQSRTPVWMYTGLGIVVAFIIIFTLFKNEKKDSNAALILMAQSRDVYEIMISDNRYTLYKVTRVHGDSVFFRVNNYQTNEESGLTAIKKKGNSAYSKNELLLFKKELKVMLDKGEIIDINSR